ncbi:FtsW/RodA/SpoVE family cell cycle protein [Paenibacillaceae bacterium WGS1546]|uniref:FtsW/RodA/SpoVE family cell cycle protein n=1 Tax=Cohnella sp. WGS1546 TaxID=3366810 RepID=UPI00372CEA6D
MLIIRKLRKLDGTLLVLMLGLVAIGTYAVYEATQGTKLDGLHVKNAVYFAAFLAPMLVVALFDYRWLAGKLAYVLYGIGIFMLVLVELFGENLNGAVRWISIGSFQFQPSEMAKLSTILLIAHWLRRRNGEKLRLGKDLLPIFVLFLVPFLFVFKQPDLGTALVFVGILLGMLWMGNIGYGVMLALAGSAVLVVAGILWLFDSNAELLAKFVQPHQLARIQSFLDPSSDADKSWHVTNAITAIGAGGMFGGTGFFTRQGFIPYVYSDSIYVIVGERFGFAGSAVLLMLFFLLIYRMVLISFESRDKAGSYIVVGIVSMFTFQIFVNVGMHIGLLPLTGISLPFISFGGSSLLISMIAIGLVMSVKIHQPDNPTER